MSDERVDLLCDDCGQAFSDFLNEMLAFPNGRHDDQVDSVSQFLNWVQGFLRYTEVTVVHVHDGTCPDRGAE